MNYTWERSAHTDVERVRFCDVDWRVSHRLKSSILTALFSILLGLLSTTLAWAISAQQASQILQGFNVFTTQTFNGNGRKCSTCHIPQADYTISPADIAHSPRPTMPWFSAVPIWRLKIPRWWIISRCSTSITRRQARPEGYHAHRSVPLLDAA